MKEKAPLGWIGIVRLGLVQAALGGIVIMATSTLNRVMVVEASLPAIVPGLLVGLHYAVQVLRPRLGYGSDLGRRRTPWILGGMAVLAFGSTLAAAATAAMATHPVAGIAVAILAFGLIGLGVGAAGTSLLVLLASAVDERRRPAAATIVWITMIAGFVVTAATAGHLLDPYSPLRLIQVTGGVCVTAFLLATLAVWGIEDGAPRLSRPSPQEPAVPFRQALGEVWAEPQARRFAVFVFVSMLAYSSQDLVLEPFAGAVFEMAPGATTKLSGTQHAGLLAGMILVAVAGTLFSGRTLGAMRTWTAGGCLASALGALALLAAALVGPGWPLVATVFASGVANGAFAIAAIAAMMQLVGAGRGSREGVRMGLWGGAQAVAFGLGGLSGAALSDLGRLVFGSLGLAYGTVFLAQAILFLWAAHLAIGVFRPAHPSRNPAVPRVPDPSPAFSGASA
ncbi:BCD family MFS transporter [uncultured Enterovirga sp.]|uniref:BCD family MFS transporter n=1 Tax=uncultured Enterovirga sp. TaxID=2026352 RepID=UPI0035CC2B6A